MMYLGNQAVGIATSLPQFADIAKVECGNYTPTEDISSDISISHSLGEIPDFLFLYTDIPTDATWTKKYILHEYICTLSGINYSVSIIRSNPGSENLGSNRTYRDKSVAASNANIVLSSFSDIYLKANVKYNYIIGKFKEVTSNAS